MRAFVVSIAGEDKPTAGNIQTFDTTSAIVKQRFVAVLLFARASQISKNRSRTDNQRKSRRTRIAGLVAAVEQTRDGRKKQLRAAAAGRYRGARACKINKEVGMYGGTRTGNNDCNDKTRDRFKAIRPAEVIQ
jgi:hypothetical protein